MNPATLPTTNEGLARALVGDAASQAFLQRCNELLDKWTTVLRQTTLPDGTTCLDARVKDSIGALVRIAESEDIILRRLALAQFSRVLLALKEKVRLERRRGSLALAKRPCERDNTIAINISIEASGNPERAKFQDACRKAARYAALASPSPLLFVTFTDMAERLIKNKSIKIGRLEAIAGEVLRISPPELVLACRYVAEVGEADARSSPVEAGQQRDLVIVRKLLNCCSKAGDVWA